MSTEYNRSRRAGCQH